MTEHLKKKTIGQEGSDWSGCWRNNREFVPSSGCTFVDEDTAREGLIAVFTFIQLHRIPVFVLCLDEESHRLFKKNKSKLKDTTILLGNPDHCGSHVLREALESYPDSVFFSSNSLFLRALSGPHDCEVALGLDLAQLPELGYINPGLVWTCNPKFPDWWERRLKLEGALLDFRCDYFGPECSYGHRRGGFLGGRKVDAFQVHLDARLDQFNTQLVSECVKRLRRDIWIRLARRPGISSLAREVLEHPKKVWYIHYGKCSGVYIDKAMRNQILPDYHIHNSWVRGLPEEALESDYPPQELERILDLKEGRHYLHQHHINVRDCDVQQAQANGWTTFTFVKNPMRTILALFYWDLRKLNQQGKRLVLSGREEVSLEEFWREMLVEDQRKLWCLPSYIRNVDHVEEFSENNLSEFLYNQFGYSHQPGRPENVSGNPGLESLYASGEVTEDMVASIRALPEYQEYVGYFGEVQL